MSRHGTGGSKYCYDDTTVLINHFDIREEKRLMQLDAILTAQRLSELEIDAMTGDFSFEHLKQIHYYLFQDIYPFAGKLRTENISKGSFSFSPAYHLEESSFELFSRIQNQSWNFSIKKDLCDCLAFYMAEINVLHPFRDGNGRSCREMIRLLAVGQGYSLDWSRVDKDKILKASIASTIRLGPLKKVMYELLE